MIRTIIDAQLHERQLLWYFTWHLHTLFFKQLKRASVPHAVCCTFSWQLSGLCFEYAAPVWHYSLNKSKNNQIEAIQGPIDKRS